MKCPKCKKTLSLIKRTDGNWYGHTYTLSQAMNDNFKMCDYSKKMSK